MKKMLTGGGVAILLSMVLGIGVAGCVGPDYDPEKDRCSQRSSRTTGTALTRNTCQEGVHTHPYHNTGR